MAFSPYSERLKQFEDWASIAEDSKALKRDKCLETKLAKITFFWIYTFNNSVHAWEIYKTHFIGGNASAGLILSVWPVVLTLLHCNNPF